jgi:FtsZ-binding cell division protein ZapB
MVYDNRGYEFRVNVGEFTRFREIQQEVIELQQEVIELANENMELSEANSALHELNCELISRNQDFEDEVNSWKYHSIFTYEDFDDE